MVVPGLAHHLQGHCQTYSHSEGCGGDVDAFGAYRVALLVFAAQEVAQHHAYGGHAEAYPHGEGVERAGEGVVALTGLAGCLVEVQHNRYTRHEEEEEHHPELLYAALRVGTVAVERLI